MFIISSIIYLHFYNYFNCKTKLTYNEFYNPTIKELNIIIKNKEPVGIYLPYLHTIEEVLKFIYIPLVYKTDHTTTMNSNITPQLLYHTNSHNFLYINKGSTKLKLLSPINKSNIKYKFNNSNNYYTYIADMDIWKSCPNNIHSLEIELKENNLYYIPPYWIYTIDDNNCMITTISQYSYLDIIIQNIKIGITNYNFLSTGIVSNIVSPSS